MSLTAVAYRLLADVPPSGAATLPGAANTKVGTIFGWGLAIVGIIAVLALFGAAISWMVAKQQHTSTEGPEKAVKVLGALILALTAVSAVNLMVT